MFTKALALLFFPALVVGQYGPPLEPATTGNSSPTSSAAAVAATAPADTPGQMNVCPLS